MPITVRCSCGKQSELPESLLGKRVRCNFCGALSIVEESAVVEHPELDWETHAATHVAESLLSGPAASADGTATGVLEAEPAVEVVAAFDEVPSGEVAAAAPQPEIARVEGAKQYKVLTQRDKWFGGKFDPERLEHALNFFAGQGWVVRSMAAGSLVNGSREELVVLLER
jgi:Domain of unknown function (DUF4177)